MFVGVREIRGRRAQVGDKAKAQPDFRLRPGIARHRGINALNTGSASGTGNAARSDLSSRQPQTNDSY